jgi:hypothetical protein
MSNTDDGSARPDRPLDSVWVGNQDLTQSRLAAQQRMIREAFAAPDVGIEILNWPPGAADGEAEFQFRPDTLLTSDSTADAVAEDLGANFSGFAGRESPINGLTVFRVQSRASDEMRALVESINGRLGPSTVTLDHVLHISAASCCPAKEPETVPSTSRGLDIPPAPDPAVNHHSSAGQNVKVAVVDTGWLAQVGAQHVWLAGVTGDPEPANLGHYKGHGTFVAGVLRAIAPQVDEYVHALFFVGGAVTESQIAPLLVDVLKTNPKIISMSAGTRTLDGEVLHGLQAFRDNYLSHTDTILVCAAGNDGDQGPFAPASLGWPEAVSVGALSRVGGLADYSNFGPWVEVYALGSDVVNAYPNGSYTYKEPPRSGPPPETATFTNGMASWSGTSFATPIVSGLIAARLSRFPGETPAQAWQALKAIADGRIAADGRPVLLPSDA